MYNYENLIGRIKDKIKNSKNEEYKNIEDILTTNILQKYGIETCIRLIISYKCGIKFINHYFVFQL